MPRHNQKLPDSPKKLFIKAYQRLCHRHTGWRVFEDFCEMTALALLNVFERDPRREERYLQTAGRYEREELELLCQMYAHTVNGLDHGQSLRAAAERSGGALSHPPSQDFLGEIFMELELSSHWKGQFFTPYHLCEFMARMTADADHLKRLVEDHDFVTVQEPACGAGAMVIAFAMAMLESGVNPQQHLHVTAVDIDPTAAHMCYIQLALLGIPAVVCIGNALSPEPWRDVLRTPMHFVGLWDLRLRRRFRLDEAPDPPQEDPEPVPGTPVSAPEPFSHSLPEPDVRLSYQQIDLFAA
jgi:hypothetical protein